MNTKAQIELALKNKDRDPELAAYILRDIEGVSDDVVQVAHTMQQDGCHPKEIDWLIGLISKELDLCPCCGSAGSGVLEDEVVMVCSVCDLVLEQE